MSRTEVIAGAAVIVAAALGAGLAARSDDPTPEPVVVLSAGQINVCDAVEAIDVDDPETGYALLDLTRARADQIPSVSFRREARSLGNDVALGEAATSRVDRFLRVHCEAER